MYLWRYFKKQEVSVLVFVQYFLWLSCWLSFHCKILLSGFLCDIYVTAIPAINMHVIIHVNALFQLTFEFHQ